MNINQENQEIITTIFRVFLTRLQLFAVQHSAWKSPKMSQKYMQKYNFGRCRFCIFTIQYQVCDEGRFNK